MLNEILKILKITGIAAAMLGLGAVGLYLAADGDYRLPLTVDQDPSLPSITLGAVTFHAESFGPPNVPVVLVIHGGPGNDYRYLLELKALSDKYRVVFYDQRGTGLSPRVPEDQLSLKNSLEDLDQIVTHYGHGKPIRIIGHSWGAMLLSAYLGKHPDKVSHALLAEPGLLSTEAAKAFLEKFKFRPSWDGIKKLSWLWLQSRHVKGDSQSKNDYFFTYLMSLDSEGSPMAGYFCDGKPPAGLLKAWRYSFASNMNIQQEGVSDLEKRPLNLVEGVENYKGKTLFLASSCNTLIGEAFQRKYHLRYFPGAEFKVIEGSGHTMFSEKPVESIAVARAFFKK